MLPLNWCANKIQRVVIWLSPISDTDAIFIPYSAEFLNSLIETDEIKNMEDFERFRVDLSMLYILETSLKGDIDNPYPEISTDEEEDETVLLMIQQLRASRDWRIESMLRATIPDWAALMLLGFPISMKGIGILPYNKTTMRLFDNVQPTPYSNEVGKFVSLLVQEAKKEKED
jgi:hypothetical protein|tara:strand:- start:12257 stop:12775 length:519 start_codon:yes stop_codon:yes gene_type:complete